MIGKKDLNQMTPQTSAALLQANTYWICLLSYSKELADCQKKNDKEGIKTYLKDCVVPKEDWNYYIDVIMKCKNTNSW
jgi:hypothetical protein